MTHDLLTPEGSRTLESALVVDKHFELQTISAIGERAQRHAESSAQSRSDLTKSPVRKSGAPPSESISQYPPSVHVLEADTRVPAETADADVTVETTVSDGVKKAQHRRSIIQLSALYFSYFLQGWNDGSTGPLLPTIQRHYGGFLSGAAGNVYLSDRIGFGKVGGIMQLSGYALDSAGGPFPLMCLGYAFSGFGISLQMAHANGFVGSMRARTSLGFGFLHAWYVHAIPHWSFYYLVSAGMAVCNIVVLASVFRGKRQDDVLAEAGVAPGDVDTAGRSKYRQILGMREVHYLSIWCLIYVGVEVALGGWIVTFIEEKRGGTASSGYISSGFWAGLMIGRLALNSINRLVGERRVMFLYTIIAILLEVTIWVVPSLIENAVAVSVIGLLLGPMYPILMNYAVAVLPSWLRTGSVGYISSLGQAGSALLPFVTGLLASKFGIGSLQPLYVSPLCICVLYVADGGRPGLVVAQNRVDDVDDDSDLGVGAARAADRLRATWLLRSTRCPRRLSAFLLLVHCPLSSQIEMVFRRPFMAPVQAGGRRLVYSRNEHSNTSMRTVLPTRHTHASLLRLARELGEMHGPLPPDEEAEPDEAVHRPPRDLRRDLPSAGEGCARLCERAEAVGDDAWRVVEDGGAGDVVEAERDRERAFAGEDLYGEGSAPAEQRGDAPARGEGRVELGNTDLYEDDSGVVQLEERERSGGPETLDGDGDIESDVQ
ncbi:major facilitator superfamily domain-containing protein [Amylocystis lapponica]|nr:major facilitator superfamily domain-containing protein [Amylocystis lapponica]